MIFSVHASFSRFCLMSAQQPAQLQQMNAQTAQQAGVRHVEDAPRVQSPPALLCCLLRLPAAAGAFSDLPDPSTKAR